MWYWIHARSGLSHFLNNVFDLTTCEFMSTCGRMKRCKSVLFISSLTESISQFLFLHPNPPKLFFFLFYFSPTDSCFIYFYFSCLSFISFPPCHSLTCCNRAGGNYRVFSGWCCHPFRIWVLAEPNPFT